jgi:hypothetical protein
MTQNNHLVTLTWGHEKDENFWIFHFREFRNCSITEVQKFFGKTWFFQIRKNFAKKFRNKFGSKNPVFEAKTGFGVPIFQKLQKITLKFYFLFLQKTRSYSNSNSNIQVQVRYAGPYSIKGSVPYHGTTL